MDALIAILPFALLFLLCPLMMFFMHRGQDHHARQAAELKPEPESTPKEALIQ